ncbi:CBS domain-containing protein [Streptomyces sp. SAI-135]|uniref:CBS domain-containing protein n=1 Tax=unclassified Streptomyces TaxID=2593676 RepID=UPI002474BC49|nr:MULTISPECIES: CBS domain-containing protein [unclassified Streptomyces]MDH6514791.1 CBS domain-containing protein [Streptomyces sp. SAI-090]MDH6546972.1 CBS domain-containing protein [Streptomyces sp. SAI-041]MDH6621127.1 CBS domain-containing protein [Streptomyces sp. SAI-135]
MPESPYTVSDVMTHTVIAVGRDAPFKEIVELIDQWKVSALPVLEGEGRVIGVVSEADLLPKEEFRDTEEGDLAERAKAGGLIADELMSTPAVTVHADASLAEAARIMARRHVKRLPVVDGVGLLQGVVSRGDLLKVFLRGDEEIAEEIRHDVLSRLPVTTDSLTVAVAEGVVTLSGTLPDRTLVPVVARAIRAVEGVVDIRLDLTHR